MRTHDPLLTRLAPMQRMMLVGEVGSGKSTLIRALSGGEFASARAMAVEYHGRFINTPGEFLENRRFYPALITASMDCGILAMLQDATRSNSLYPPLFCSFFTRRIVGLVSKSDAAGADCARAERFLRNAGAKQILRVSARTGDGLDALRAMLA